MVDKNRDRPEEPSEELEQEESLSADEIPEEPTEFLHAGTIDWPAKRPSPQAIGSRSQSALWLKLFWANPIARILAYLCLFFLLETFVSQLAEPIFHTLRARRNALDDIGETLAAVSAVLALWMMVRGVERRKMADVGFPFRGIVVDTVSGYAIGMGAISVAIGFMGLFGLYHVAGTNAYFRPWMPLLAMLAAAIAEETVFRGMVFRVLEYRYGSLVALIASSLFFGLSHIANGAGWIGPLFISLEAGLLLGAAYMATRRLWLGIGIHWAWNFFESSIYGAQDSGIGVTNTLLRAKFHGPTLLTGGAFGPEASVIALIVDTLAGLLLLRVAIRAGQWKPAGEWQQQSLTGKKRAAV